MNRDRRYGACLILAAVFLSVSFFHLSKTSFRSKPTRTQQVNNDKAAALPANTAEAAARRPSNAEPRSEATGVAIDLNSATKEDLLTLPGVGKVTADRILAKRRELGAFSTVEELTEVERLGKVKLNRIRGLVTVKNGQPKPLNP